MKRAPLVVVLVTLMTFSLGLMGGCAFLKERPEVPLKAARGGIEAALVYVDEELVDDKAAFRGAMKSAFSAGHHAADRIEAGDTQALVELAVSSALKEWPEIAPYEELMRTLLFVGIEMVIRGAPDDATVEAAVKLTLNGELALEASRINPEVIESIKWLCREGFKAVQRMEAE